MKSITMYSMNFCPYCDRARQLLEARSIPFKEIKIDPMDEAQWLALEQKSSMKTLPQIFLGDECLGGFTELSALDKSGELAKKVGF